AAEVPVARCGCALPERLRLHGAIGHQRIAADRGTELDNRVLVPAGGEIRKCPAITDWREDRVAHRVIVEQRHADEGRDAGRIPLSYPLLDGRREPPERAFALQRSRAGITKKQ